MSRLPLGLRARPDEPGHGILLRLGARNGYGSAHQFAGSLGFDFRKVLTGADATHIAALAGLEPGPVGHCSPVMILPDRKVGLSGQRLQLGDWSTRDRRYCPACHALDLEEARRLGLQPEWYVSHRSMWDVRLISACPRHGIPLIGQCYVCDEKLGWRATDILHCAGCRADLLLAPCNALADPVGDYVSLRLGGQRSKNDVLDALPLSEAMRLCERLGQIRSVGVVHTLPRQSSAMLARARSEGLRMTLNLEVMVASALDSVILRNDGQNGLHSAYGWIYGEWLSLADQSSGPVRQLLFHHAVTNGVISADEARLGNRPPETITMTQAARSLGMSYKRARTVASQAGIVPRGSRHSVAFTLDPKAVAKLRTPAGATTFVREVATLLGTGKAQIADLLKAGLLHRGADGRVSSASIGQLVDSLIRQCCEGSSPDAQLPMAIAARDAAVPLWRIVKAVRDGAIPCWQTSASGLSQFQVRMCDVIGLRSPPRAMTIEAVARRIGVHHDCVRAMARRGIVTDANGHLTEEALAQFELQYAVGSAMARRLGRSSRALYRQLSNAGVKPAFDLKTYRQAIYRRSDIARLDLLS